MDRLRRIITRIYYTLKSDKLYGNHYASAQLYDFLIEYRKIADNRLSSFYTAQSVALADVLQYIEEHYPEQIKLNELAKSQEYPSSTYADSLRKIFSSDLWSILRK